MAANRTISGLLGMLVGAVLTLSGCSSPTAQIAAPSGLTDSTASAGTPPGAGAPSGPEGGTGVSQAPSVQAPAARSQSLAAGAQPLRLAFHLRVTGLAVSLGTQARAGAQLAVDEVNARGGVRSQRLEVVVEDAGADTASATSPFERLMAHRPVAVMGSPSTAQVLAVSPIVQREAIPYLFAAGGTAVTRQDIPWLFRIGPDDEQRYRAAVRFLIDRQGKVRLASLFVDSDAGKRAAAVVANEARGRYGKDLVASEAFAGTAQDLSAQLQSIQRAGTDAVIVSAPPGALAPALKQLKQLGDDFPIIATDAVVGPETSALLADADLDGVYVATGAVPQASADPTVRAWVESFRQRNPNLEPDQHAVAYYDGVHLLAQALARANSTEPQAVRDALRATKNYPGLLFPYGFDERGDGVHVVVITHHRGKVPEMVDMIWEGS
jgi:branched-chain amino acid transport system substrate-binding protein